MPINANATNATNDVGFSVHAESLVGTGNEAALPFPLLICIWNESRCVRCFVIYCYCSDRVPFLTSCKLFFCFLFDVKCNVCPPSSRLFALIFPAWNWIHCTFQLTVSLSYRLIEIMYVHMYMCMHTCI